MENFTRIAERMEVQPALRELATQPDLWKLLTARQDTPGSPHHDTECIVLRGPKTVTIESVFSDVEADWLPYIAALPELHAAVSKCVAQLGAVTKLGRVMVVNLKAGGAIDEHRDEGAYAEHYERFHLVLSSAPGNWFECGSTTRYLQPGELWQFNHRKLHRVKNCSAEDRIHIIIDARREPAQEK